ncbi:MULTISPECIES: hypothetical protein [Tenacibaculum]|uniref:hypothetical protein n=1 Tax=Tenacibaculum TaxID=104267 RepID=UPI001F0B1310|nr:MULTISPECIES: hypothetical protein [Tenacibaculum]MCH3883089.1 hypothetical protein [Tenacibaculum aquimarinum]MDO6600584.1 hypothetical protein [Tenacibaculum sp. 1_MG-2023]
MNKIFTIIVSLFIALNCYSQDESVVDKVAKKTCEYLEGLDLGSLSADERNMKLGLYIFKMYDEYKADFNKEGIYLDLTKGADEGRKFGVKIGTRMASFCPEALMMFANEEGGESDEEKFSVKGELIELSGIEISKLSLKDNKGKTQKFIWINNFEGSDKLINEEFIQGLKVKLHYRNVEIYSPKLKEYIVKKQISKIEYLD